MAQKIKWKRGISRKETPIRSEMIATGASKYVNKLIGVDNNNFLFLFKEDKGSAYFDINQIILMGKRISELINNNQNFIESHAEELRSSCQNLVKVAKTVGGKCDTKSKIEDLKIYFNDFLEAHFKFSAYMMIPIAIEEVIGRKVREQLKLNDKIGKDGEKLDYYLTKLLTPEKLPETNKEIRDLFRIVENIRKGNRKNSKSLIKLHWEKYRWLSVYSPDVKPYTLDYFDGKVKELLETKSLDNNFKNEDSEWSFDRVVDKLGLEGEILSLIKMLRKYVYLRTYRVEQLTKAYFYIQPLFQAISTKGDISLYEFCLCSLAELDTFLKGGNLPRTSELKERRNAYLYIIKGGKFTSFTGKEATITFESEVKERKVKSGRVKELKGTSVSMGIGEGPARIILDVKKLGSFCKDEVLITMMTNPDYVVVMNKASAVVTEEGGVLCHAAIVSRELGIPCVVGAKNATKVIANGDYVKVDADKGLVSIIQKVK